MSLPLLALFLATFSIGTTEFVVAGLLPQVAGGLGVDIPAAGYLISGYALAVAIGGPIMGILTSRLERKSALVVLMGVFIAGNALCGLAPSYGWLMFARIVIALSHGAAFGIAVIAAGSLVPPARHASAIALVVGGITVANVLGVPAGTAIGSAFGWRAAFCAIALLGLVAAVFVAIWLPRSPPSEEVTPGLGLQIRVLGKPGVYLQMLIIVLGSAAFFSMFSYIAPVLLHVVGLAPHALPWVLSVLGVGAVIGNFAGGRFADWKLMPAIVGIFALQTVCYLLLLVLLPYFAPAFIVLFLWSLANFSFSAPCQSRIMKGAREAPRLAASLLSTVFNLGISIGAAVGAQALAHGLPYGQLPWIGVALIVPALVLSVLALLLDRRDEVAAKA